MYAGTDVMSMVGTRRSTLSKHNTEVAGSNSRIMKRDHNLSRYSDFYHLIRVLEQKNRPFSFTPLEILTSNARSPPMKVDCSTR